MEKCSTLIYLVDNCHSFSPEIVLSEDFLREGESMLDQLFHDFEVPISSDLTKRTVQAAKALF